MKSFWNEGRLYHLEGKHFESFDEVLEACGLDFDAEMVPMTHPDDDGTPLEQPFVSLVRRKDNKIPLGVNSKVYGLTQYRQWFSIPEDLWQNGVTLVYGGLQGHGSRAYLVMRAEGSIKLANEDVILNEFTVTASHDGTSKLQFMMTPRRTGNQSIVAFDRPLISYKHSKNVQSRISKTHSILYKVKESWAEFSESTQAMIKVEMTDDDARGFIKSVIGDGESTRTENVRAKVFDLYKSVGIGRAVPACQGTLFGLVQAFCEYGDHHAIVRKSKYLDEASAALDSKTLGATAKQKAKGWSMAMTLIRNKKKLTGLTKGF